MPQINKRKLCNKHTFYDAIVNPNGCPLCKKESNKTYDSTLRAEDRKKIYNCKRWTDLRDYVRIRDEFLCQECKRNGLTVKGEEVDHIKELSDRIDLAYDESNLELLCKKCHSVKTNNEREKRR